MKRCEDPRELAQIRAASAVVIVLGATVLFLVFLYGDSPRPTVDRLNLFLAPVVAVQFGIVGPAIWRLRRSWTKTYRDVEL